MDRTEIKDARVIMRRVDEHFRQAHLNLGANNESVGFVDVITHPNSILSTLNYVTPRRNTAWVSGKHIEDGLVKLREKNRRSRVRFADGLFPPIFGRSLREIGLELETEIPIMVYSSSDAEREAPQVPTPLQVKVVTDQQGLAIWWYVWRNAFYNVYTSGIEPLVLGRDMRSLYLGEHLNLVLSTGDFPIGVARLTLHKKSAHLVSLAIMKEQHTPEREALLIKAAIHAALDVDCNLVFVTGKNTEERTQYRAVGFEDYGSVVCYADPPAEQVDETVDEHELSVLIL